MKFPSITRIPKHKKFDFTPRYYDPVKEDVKNRTERIKAELSEESDTKYRENIKKAFEIREKRKTRTDLMQLVLITIVVGCSVGWIYFGNYALYVFMFLLALYIFLRSRKYFQH